MQIDNTCLFNTHMITAMIGAAGVKVSAESIVSQVQNAIKGVIAGYRYTFKIIILYIMI